MDKQGYREFLEAIMSGYEDGDYEMVASYADEIDFSKIKEVKVLEAIGESYAALKEYGNAKEAFVAAYQQNPSSKQLVYRLGEICIELDDLDSAVEFYDEFCNLSGRDPKQLILKYKIGKAGGIPKKELIKVLEKYNSRETDEQWKYELALLYHETNQADKCVAICDDIFVWYADGEYVKKALELKFRHAALSLEQQAKYERMMSAYLEPEERTWENIPNEELKYSQIEEQMAEEFAGEFLGEFNGTDASTIKLQREDSCITQSFEENTEEVPQGGFWAVMQEKKQQDEDDLIDTKVMKLEDILKELGEYDEETQEETEEFPEVEKYSEKINEEKKTGPETISLEQLRNMIVAGSLDAINEEENNPDIPEDILDIDEVEDEEEEPDDGEVDEELADRDVFREYEDDQGETRVISKTELFAALNDQEQREEEKSPEPDLSQTLAIDMEELYIKMEGTQAEEDNQSTEVGNEAKSEPEKQLGLALAGIMSDADAFLEEASTSKVSYVPIGEASAAKLGTNSARLSPAAKKVTKPSVVIGEIPVIGKTMNTQPEEKIQEAIRILDNVDISYMALAREDDGQYGFNLEYMTEEDETIEGQISFYDVYESYSKKLEENKDEVAVVEAERLRMIQEAVKIDSKVVLPYDMNDLEYDDIYVVDEETAQMPEPAAEMVGLPETYEEPANEPEEVVEITEVEEEPAEEMVGLPETYEEPANEPEEVAEITEAEAEEPAEEMVELTGTFEEPVEDAEAAPEVAEVEVAEPAAATDEEAPVEIPSTRRFAEEEDFEEDYEEKVYQKFIDEDEIFGDEVPEAVAEEPVEETVELAGAFEEPEETVASKDLAEETEEAEADELLIDESVEDEIFSENIETPYVSASGYSLSENVKEEISEFLLIDGMEEKITEAISGIIDNKRAGDPTGGNLIVTGDTKSGKTYLSIAVIKAVAQELGEGNGRVAKIQASALNGKDMKMVFDKINGCDLVIENVGYLEDNTVLELQNIITSRRYNSMVVLEGNQLAVENIFNSYPELKEEFLNKIEISELSIVQWADIAMNYAEERGFKLDDMAKLALHAKINEMNLPTVRLSYDDILDVMDNAISKAEKRNTGKLFAAFRKNSVEKKEIIESDFN